jgi:nucleoside-diphosphate-sugar epimerase
VLVTGATGFFGPAIVARLREAGHEVFGASRRVPRADGTLSLDVTVADSCNRAVEAVRPDVVVHAAALAHVHPGKMSEDLCRSTNIGGAERMIDASVRHGVRRFVFISSVMVYGDYDLPPVVSETNPPVAHGVYGKSKIEAERACLARHGDIQVVILRMATMYSADWLDNIRKRVRPLSSGTPLYFTLDPAGRRYSLCSRRNGAEAVLWASDGRLPPGIYNVADQYEYCQAEIRRAVERVDGPGRTVHIPAIVPRLMWHLVRVAVPVRRWRENARSRYWKFCQSNVYSPARLNKAGLATPPDLLALEGAQ